MKYYLPLFLLSSIIAPLSAQESGTSNDEEKVTKDEDARFRIPLGAVISDVTLPYYDKNRRQVSLLTAVEMTVKAADPLEEPDEDPDKVRRLQGKDLKLWLFDKKGEIRSTTTIPKAEYNVGTEQLQAFGTLLMRGVGDSFAARADGGIFSLETGRALLLGPATTIFERPQKKKKEPKTAMNLRPILPLTAAIQLLTAAPPLEIPAEELAEFERLVAPRLIPNFDGHETFNEANQLNEAVAKRLAEYLTSVGRVELLTQIKTPPATPVEKDIFEKIFEVGPNQIRIDCDNGIYVDGTNYEIVYLGNIKLVGQGVTMTCKKDLKVIFDPPPEKTEEKKTDKKPEGNTEKNDGKVEEKKGDQPEKKKEDDDPLGGFGGFGALKQFTASGSIRLSGVSKGKKFHLGGDRALYQTSGEGQDEVATIILRGDKLAFIHEAAVVNGKKDGADLKLYSITKDAWAKVTINKGTGKKNDLTIQFGHDRAWTTVIETPAKK